MLEEFVKQIDEQINNAIEIGKNCSENKIVLNTNIENICNLDKVVEYVRNLFFKKLIDENVAWNISIALGILLGEMIISKHECKWSVNKDNIPVIETEIGNQLSPITKIYKIILSEDDTEGRPSSFYNGFIALQNYGNN